MTNPTNTAAKNMIDLTLVDVVNMLSEAAEAGGWAVELRSDQADRVRCFFTRGEESAVVHVNAGSPFDIVMNLTDATGQRWALILTAAVAALRTRGDLHAELVAYRYEGGPLPGTVVVTVTVTPAKRSRFRRRALPRNTKSTGPPSAS